MKVKKMKKQIGIEIVCTGNGGRSPMGETLGKEDVLDRGLEDSVKIYSSGSAVDDVMNLRFPMTELIQYIEIGLRSGTYQGKALAIAEHVVRNKDEIAHSADQGDAKSKKMIGYCMNYLMADEVAKRNMVLLEEGLVPEGHFHRQTAAMPGVDLVLTMKESNAKKVKEIYAGNGLEPKPIIVPICEYAGLEGAISDPFGREIQFWRDTRDLIGNAVKKSIDRAVQEYLK
jgi:protein-tyrosine-phosphatase